MPAPQNCAVCASPCNKGYVAVGDNHYCVGCFKCATCEKALGGQPHIPHEGKVYCEGCYHEAHSPRCGHCDEIITGDHVQALGKMWHPDHFLCSDCGIDFPDDKFHKHEERPYCKPCYEKKTAELCAACKKDIIGEDMFEAHDKKYHKACFVCATGGHAIEEGQEFHVYNENIYCTHHLGAMLEMNCATCGHLISAEYIMVHDKKMHAKCWKCKTCDCVLGAGNARPSKADPKKFVCNDCCVKEGGTVIGGASGSGGSGGVGGATAGMGDLSMNAERVVMPAGVCQSYTYESLRNKAVKDLPFGVDKKCREQYLSDEEFVKVFGMDKAAFNKLPAWRRKQKKQAAKLF